MLGMEAGARVPPPRKPEASVLGVVLRSISQGSSNRSTQSNQRSTSAPQGMASDRSSSTGRDTCKGASISPILIDPRPSSVRRTSDPNVSSAAIDRATITPLVCSHGHVHLEDMHNTGPVAARWSPYMAVRGVHRSTRKRRRGPIKYSRPALRRMVLPNSHRIRHHHLPFTPAIHHTRNAPTPDRDGPPHPGGAAAVMGGDDSFVGRMVEGGVTGAGIGAVSGTMSTFWNSAGARVNRAKLAQQVVPTIAANMGYLACTGMAFKAGECLMETWTGKEGEAINTAFGGAVAGAFVGFRSGSIPIIAASALGSSLVCVAIHLNGNKLT